jgi:hypothetical protein
MWCLDYLRIFLYFLPWSTKLKANLIYGVNWFLEYISMTFSVGSRPKNAREADQKQTKKW